MNCLLRSLALSVLGFILLYPLGAFALSSGSSESGTLLLKPAVVSHTFSASAGDVVHLSLLSETSAYAYIYKPDGTYYGYASNAGYFAGAISAGGTYRVDVVAAYLNNELSPYTIHYTNTSNANENGSIPSGGESSGDFTFADIDSYSINVDAGAGIHLSLSSTIGAYAYVYKPDGSYFGYTNSVGFMAATATVGGVYHVIVRPMYTSQEGDYTIHFANTSNANENGVILDGGTRSSYFSLNDVDSYTFVASAGDDILISYSSTIGSYAYVYKPDGSYLGYANSVGRIVYYPNALYSGTYRVVTRPMYSTQTGVYDVSFTLTDNSDGDGTIEDEEKVAALQNCFESSIEGANSFVGNPINFAHGFKLQRESDYNDGALNLVRIYRSDVSWADTNFGSYWSSNYYRSVVFPTVDDVEIVDGRNAVIKFDKVGSDWVVIDGDYPATFEDVYDGGSLIGYLYITNDDTSEYFDLSGKLERIEYRAGESLNFTYNGSGYLDSVTDENGKSLNYTYSGNLISNIITPTGTFTYTYDGNDNLITVTKPDSKTRTYHYEDTSFVNAMTGITDESGNRYATYSYDANGRAISSQHYGGVDNYSIAYNGDGTTTITNPLGKQTTYTFETYKGINKIVNVDGHVSTNCAAANKSYSYNDKGWLISKTDWLGNVTAFSYDGRGSVTNKIEAYGTSAERSTSYTYDYDYRLPDIVSEIGKSTDYDYDSYGRLVYKSVTDTNSSESRITTYTYNANTTDANGNTVLGRLASTDGSRTDVSDVTTYDYDGNSRLIKVTNALGHEVETTSFDSADRPLTLIDANNVQSAFTYDVMGRLSTSTDGVGTAIAGTTTYGYDDNGNVTSITQPNGIIITYVYDNAQRLTGISDAQGNTVTYTLDDAGNRTSEVYKDASLTLHFTSSNVFDELSRLLQNVDANNDVTSFTYDVNSNQISVTDGNLNATAFAFDGLDRLVSSTDALNSQRVNSINELNQVTDVTDPRSNTTSYIYNAFGDVVQEISPDRGTTSYTIDEAGNVTSKTDARSEVVYYDYDALNRIISTSYASDSTLDASFTYDALSGCGFSKGRLCTVSDASGTSDYIYDELGRLTDVTEIRGSLSFTTSYGYDASGILTSITMPSGRVVTYGLDSNGQVSSVSADVGGYNTSLASLISYLPFGGVEALSYGNGVLLTNTYNTAYQLTNRSIGSMMNDSFTYDGANNITVKGATSYTYDALYRLLDEDGSMGLFDYTYDEIGNRLTETKDGTPDYYTYPLDSSILSAIGATSIITDYAGNITQDISRDYIIDAAGHIESVSISGSIVGSYIYDANNQRTSKDASGVITHYVYGKNGLLYGEYDNSGSLIREYVYLDGKPLAQIGAGENLSYLHTDYLGTPRYASDSSAIQVWDWDSDAFGNGSPSGSETINLRFAGQYYDAESGLHYNWNRYYDPETGRYISSDPIGLDGGLNTFAYVSANPVMFIDPEGLAKKKRPKGHGRSGGAENTQSKRKSTEKKHQDGQKGKDDGRGREKGDTERRVPRKKPGDWKGSWPPKIPGLPPIFPPVCVMFPDYCGDPNMAFITSNDSLNCKD